MLLNNSSNIVHDVPPSSKADIKYISQAFKLWRKSPRRWAFQGKENIPYVGIFACRCPQRPNRIAISTVELLSRKSNVLKVKGLDIVDGTPIIDIKPYTRQYDEIRNAKVPVWIKKLIF